MREGQVICTKSPRETHVRLFAHLDDQVKLQLTRRVRVLPVGDHPVRIARQRPARYAADERLRVAQRRRQQAHQLADVGHQPPVAALADSAQRQDR